MSIDISNSPPQICQQELLIKEEADLSQQSEGKKIQKIQMQWVKDFCQKHKVNSLENRRLIKQENEALVKGIDQFELRDKIDLGIFSKRLKRAYQSFYGTESQQCQVIQNKRQQKSISKCVSRYERPDYAGFKRKVLENIANKIYQESPYLAYSNPLIVNSQPASQSNINNNMSFWQSNETLGSQQKIEIQKACIEVASRSSQDKKRVFRKCKFNTKLILAVKSQLQNLSDNQDQSPNINSDRLKQLKRLLKNSFHEKRKKCSSYVKQMELNPLWMPQDYIEKFLLTNRNCDNRQIEEPKEIDQFYCTLCDLKTNSLNTLKQHAFDDHQKSQFCIKCEKIVKRIQGHNKEKHPIICCTISCSQEFTSHDDHVEHLLENHMEGYSFFYYDNPEKVKDWLDDKDINYGKNQAFNLLRSKFHKRTSNYYFEKEIIKNPNVYKILMCRNSDLEIFGFAAFTEQKSFGDNFMELLYFCTGHKKRGLGIRFMSQICEWAATKKLYSEILTMADIYAVGFFDKNEFVMIDYIKFNKNRTK